MEEAPSSSPSPSWRLFLRDSRWGRTAYLSEPGQERRSPLESSRFPGHYFVFDDLDPGSYTVTIEDSRFHPWQRSDVQPGTRVDARLTGNAALRLEVVDGRTGAPIDRYQLEVFSDPERGVRRVRLREADEDGPVNGLHDGLLPIPQTLRIETEGFCVTELSLTELEPEETREVRVELFPPVRLQGTVMEADRRTPVPGAQVSLRAVDEEVRPYGWGRGEWYFGRNTEADDAGRFEFTDVPAGNFALRAELNPWFSGEIAELPISPGEARSDLAIVLPPSASLRGRLIVPDGADCTNLHLVARSAVAPLDGSRVTAREGLAVDLDRDGSFAARLLPPGGYVLEVARVGAQEDGLSGAVTDAAGSAIVEYLFPGDYSVLLRPVDGRWRVPAADFIPVEAGETASCAIEVVVVRGLLRALDAGAEVPLERKGIRIDAADSSFFFFATTDDQGRLELELPRGSYTVRRSSMGTSSEVGEVPFEWSDDGNTPVEVRLPHE